MSSPSFAAVVRRYRLAAGFTQEQLAERASLSLRTIGDIERGRIRRPYRRSAQLLGIAFGLSDSELDRFVLSARPSTPGSPGPRSPVWAAEAAPNDPTTAIPRQLPLKPPRIIGRARVLAELSGLLDAAAGTRMVIVAISGIGGAGKTALALRCAYREAHRFPDGQLYVDLHGSGPDSRPVPPGAALSGLLQSLQVPSNGKTASTDARAAWYRSVVGGRRMMIVLDNARDAAQVRPLLPSAPGCAVVITSRFRLTSLAAREGAHLVNLDVLTDREAQQLLTALLGPARVAREPDAAMAIARGCFGLPLALAIVAARALASSHLPLTALARRLTDPECAWSILGGGDPACDIRTAFSSGLDMVSSDARRMLQALAAQPGSSITAGAAAGLAGRAAAHAGELLDELVLANLLREEPSGGFTMNGLLRLYLCSSPPGRPGAARATSAGVSTSAASGVPGCRAREGNRSAPARAVPRGGPLGVRTFRLLTVGQFASTTGDYCYAVALPWFVLSAHAGTIVLGTVLACYGIPRAALIPVGGVLADRFGPRTTMLAADVARCVLLGLFVVLASCHAVSLAALAPAAGLLGAATGVFIPASYAIVPTLLETRQLTAGNGVFTAAQQAGSLLGPAAGGALIAAAGPPPAFGVDASSFAISALALVLIPRAAARRTLTTPSPPTASAAASLRSGETGPGGEAGPGVLAMLRTSRVLQISVLLTLCANLAMGGLLEVAVPDLAHERFGPSGLGVMLVFLAAGSMAGTLAAARGGSLRRPVPVATAVYMIMAAGMAAVPFLGGLPGAAAAMTILGAGNGLGNVLLVSRLQMWAPPRLLGRLMSTVMLSAYGSYPVSVAVTGVLVHHTGPAAFFPLAAVLAALPLLGGLTQREWRNFGVPSAGTPPRTVLDNP